MTIDVSALMNAPVGKLDTKYEVTPAGEYPNATIDVTDMKNWWQTGKRQDGTDYLKLNVPVVVHDEPLRQKLGREKLTSRITLWIDTDDGRVSNDKGKNVALGQLREALSQLDDPNWTFQQLPGAGPLKVITKVTVGSDGREYSEVTRVAKAT